MKKAKHIVVCPDHTKTEWDIVVWFGSRNVRGRVQESKMFYATYKSKSWAIKIARQLLTDSEADLLYIADSSHSNTKPEIITKKEVA
jgi:hypothetical protein|tara:strand:+ start:3941 stop:4201 length:261 start_codon:yes stop_codon:yes gene_type:complete